MAREFTVMKACHLPNEFGKVAHHNIGAILRGAFYSRFLGSGLLRENNPMPAAEPPQKPTELVVPVSKAEEAKENVTPKKEEPAPVEAPKAAQDDETKVLTPTPVVKKTGEPQTDSLSLSAVEQMTKKELKAACKELGLRDEGSTFELRKRLIDDINSK